MPESEIGTVVGGRYRLERKANEGAMGVVFFARDIVTGTPVAVKRLLPSRDPHHELRFLREAELLTVLKAPQIVAYLDHGRLQDGSPFLVMEWLEGETLEDRLARGRLDSYDVARLGVQVASGLAVAHANGVVHRDVKPANLFLVDKAIDKLKILDFGVARRTDDPQPLTAAGAVVGTLAWLSPEQARGEQLDARSDLFSLGSVLYACLAGDSPFARSGMAEVLVSLEQGRMTPIDRAAPGTAPELASQIGSLLQTNRNDRPADASEVARSLTAIRDALSYGNEPTAAASRPEQRVHSFVTEPTAAAPLFAKPHSFVTEATAAAPSFVAKPHFVGTQATNAGPVLPPSVRPLAPAVPTRSGAIPAPAPIILETKSKLLLLIFLTVLLLLATTAALMLYFFPPERPAASATGRAASSSGHSLEVQPEVGPSSSASQKPAPAVADDLGIGDRSNVDPFKAFDAAERGLLKDDPGSEVVVYFAEGPPGGRLDLTAPLSVVTATNAHGKTIMLHVSEFGFIRAGARPGLADFARPVRPPCSFRQLYEDAVRHGLPADRPFQVAFTYFSLSLSEKSGPQTTVLQPGTCKMIRR